MSFQTKQSVEIELKETNQAIAIKQNHIEEVKAIVDNHRSQLQMSRAELANSKQQLRQLLIYREQLTMELSIK